MRGAVALVVAALLATGCTVGDDDDADHLTAPTTVSADQPDGNGEADESVPASSTPAPASTVAPATPTTAANATPLPTTTAITTDVTAPGGGGGTAIGSLDDADVQLETEEGTIQIGVAEVPDGVSDSFPIPPDLDVQLSSATETDYGFSGVSSMTIPELAAFYASELVVAGYEISARQEVDGVLAVYTFERADQRGQVAISSAPGGGSSVLVTIGDGSTAPEATFEG